MSDFIDKVKEEAKAVSAAIDNELTVLEGAGGYDPLAEDENAESTEESKGGVEFASDDTEGGVAPAEEPSDK
ncbi:hypothetical protein [Gordonia soli]|uniref:Uncharacterized protein n=1 Tax=Gordonia soli NBRC 108243 TaxID=1223545 RepID=M0QJH9_9ACTN|nr:hypothetical protein [Gordonia soli]GAC67592.1 hypothetical protein GS4_08_01770 [Gordonia soli NBRC 108243]